MKKIIALIMVAVLMLTFAACGNTEDKTNNDETTTEASAEISTEANSEEVSEEVTDDTTEATEESTTEATTKEAEKETTTKKTEEPTKAPSVKIASAVELLNNVWAKYAEADKFPVAGGDEANMNMEGPGAFGLADGGEGFSAITHFPIGSISKIDSAATLMHMMNANTFTAAAYHVVGGDMNGLAKEVKESVMSTRWMCGFPERFVIITVDDYMVSCFGNGELVNTFKSKVKTAYPSATVVVDEAIVA